MKYHELFTKNFSLAGKSATIMSAGIQQKNVDSHNLGQVFFTEPADDENIPISYIPLLLVCPQ